MKEIEEDKSKEKFDLEAHNKRALAEMQKFAEESTKKRIKENMEKARNHKWENLCE
jgi:hypothetical protein